VTDIIKEIRVRVQELEKSLSERDREINKLKRAVKGQLDMSIVQDYYKEGGNKNGK
jgi:hypothetical protein